MLIKRAEPPVIMSSTEEGPLDKKFEKLVKETLEVWHVPGVSVAVVDGDKTYAQVRTL
jgi:CubicO group peptidase (beta-lactamase class C family)